MERRLKIAFIVYSSVKFSIWMQKAKYILSECYIEEENSCWISKMRYRWTGLTYRLGLLFVECDPYLHRERGATHTVTHTRKRTDGNNGINRLRPHPFWTKNRPKALYSSGWMAFERLVRMRSAVRICPAAPKKHRKLRFSMLFVAKMLKNVWVKMWVNCLTHIVTHIPN